MIGYLKSIFMRPKTIDDFLDKDDGHLSKIGGWIGNQQFTEEEKARMFAALSLSVRQFAIDTAKESTDRSKTRRSLAILWIKVQLGLVLASFIAAIFDYPQVKFMWEITSSDLMMYGTMGVMMFFFGAYGYGAHVSKKK